MIPEALLERFLAQHLETHPVDATFMGLPGHDGRLPRADAEAVERERSALLALQREASALPEGQSAAERLERLMLLSQLTLALAELDARPRHHNPAWYTGEAAFGLISLLLPDSAGEADALRQRLESVPRFLREGAAQLSGRALPGDWCERARRESLALARLLARGLRRHPLWHAALERPAEAAVAALQAFATALQNREDADPAAGEAYLELVVRDVHHLPLSLDEAEARALEALERYRQELETMAEALEPGRSWREQLEASALEHPEPDGVLAAYERCHETAMAAAEAAGLVTPADDYALRFEMLPEWAREVAGELYFLFYRSPPAARPGTGSHYWVFPPAGDLESYLRSQNCGAIKITHAVHHGSIGHHTQNARARASAVRLGQLAGTDCASGIAMLAGGTLIEGWACYAQELLLEAEGFYTPRERLLLKHAELRNAAMCLAELRLHRGRWTLPQMRRFYQDEVGVPAARAWAETTRNAIYPGTRLMYWLGTEAIRQARRDLDMAPRRFHDALLSFGAVPVTAAVAELARAPDKVMARKETP